MRIGDTAGSFFPLEKTWKGRGGKVTWKRAGLPDVYCQFDAYQIPLSGGNYRIKNARLAHPACLGSTQVTGTFEDKLTVQNNNNYPVFESADKQLEIPFGKTDLAFTGGLLLKGKNLYGVGPSSGKALLKGKGANPTHHFEARADRFKLDIDNLLAGEEVAATLFFDTDSIYHPAVRFKLLLPEKMLSLQRGDRGSNRNPFFNSLTQMTIDARRLDWDMNTGEIIVNEKKANLGHTNKRATFESAHYFDVQDYRRLQSAASVHPLAVLKSVADREKSRIVAASQYAQAINPRFDVSSINSLLYDLVEKGYILYNKDRREIEVLHKVFHYCQASQQQADFDILRVRSKSDHTNAKLLLDEKKIEVSDVRLVEFSDRQKVAAQPRDQQLSIGANRSLSFDGKLFAGLATFQGKDFNFEYDPFVIHLDSVDYYDLFVWNGITASDGTPEAFSIGSRIENTSGMLLIDASSNKSGREDIPTFPAFKTTGPAYVYYDFDETMSGCYSRDSFFFELYPFTLNALDQFSADQFHFKGNMHSAGIFPAFEETLTLQEEDHSLGFVHRTPAEGYQAYGKGHFDGNIDLSNRGLHAQGKIQYKWATLESEDIVFRPDQMTATAEHFSLTEDLSNNIPTIAGQNIQIDWRPAKDSMYIQALDQPFQLYETGKHSLMDMLILTPDGLHGRGVFDWDLGNITSDLFALGSHTVSSDTSNLQIKVKGFNDLALHTENVVSKMDFEHNTAFVKANSDTITTDFPYNEYRTSMNAFNWKIDEEEITFVSGTEEAGQFLALSKAADSLNFQGHSARLNLRTNELLIGGVPYIEVADARIFPDEEKVMILPGGEMPALKNARIVAGTGEGRHQFHKATLTIDSRNEYAATGVYDYPIGDKIQEVEFVSITAQKPKKNKKKRKSNTLAETTVSDLLIDHYTTYQGDIRLSTQHQELLFDGFARINWQGIQSDWFAWSGRGNKEDLKIPYGKELLNKAGEQVYTGLFVDRRQGNIYPTFLNAPSSAADRPVFVCDGLVDYWPQSQRYVFGDSLKVVAGVLSGQSLEVDHTGVLTAEGWFDVGPTHPLAGSKVVGRTRIDQKGEGEAPFNFMAGIELHLPEKLMRVIYDAFNQNSFQLRPMTYSDDEFYEMALANWIPDAPAMKMTLAQLKSAGELHLPQQYNDFSFLFSELPMIWNEDYRSFISAKDKLGLNSVAKAVLNKEVEAFIEFRTYTGEENGVTLYLVAPDGHFYFLSYRNAVLSTCSDNEHYMALLDGLSNKERMRKVKKGGAPYEIQAISTGRARQFVNRVREGR